MWAILKVLRENCPCKLSLCSSIRVLPSEGQRESACRGPLKKASFRTRTVKQEIVRGMLERRVHGLNHRVDWDDHLINEAKVLNLIGKH